VFWRCFGGVLAVFWRCFGGVLAVFWRCFGGVLAVFYFICLFYMKRFTRRHLGKRTVKHRRGGGKRQGTKRRSTRLLPKLKKSLNNRKRYHYKLAFKPRGRRMAINEGIRYETKRGRPVKAAATAKKGRLNILRIYRRNKKLGECEKITSDMRYIDRKYGLGKTKNICGK